MSPLLLGSIILLMLIPLTNAASVDSNCTSDLACERPGELICRNGRCQCNAPWYQPCDTSCIIQLRFAYQGEGCRQDVNCLDNARCDNASRRCICRENFSAFNGLCYKRNNESCGSDFECWSGQCDNSIRRCTCKLGYEPSNDGRCRQKLARLYNDWSQANAAKDFCYNTTSCLNLLAECKDDTVRAEKFCQCPSSDYTTNTNNQECETVDNDRLSPYSEFPSTDNRTCVNCKDRNAVCALVSNQKTCWCRAGFDKVNDICQRTATRFIFPNANDSSLHDYISNCVKVNATENTVERVCTCAPYYEFDVGSRLCRKIERKWINEYFEYGLCTRIKSDDEVQSQNSPLCPKPLECRASGDKYVCSCGLNKFLEQQPSNQTICVYRLGKNTTDLTPCLANTYRRNGTCYCDPGFRQVDGDRRCELILLPDNSFAGCVGNPLAGETESCILLYGGGAQYCQPGECRCGFNTSFASGNNSFCYGLLNVQQSTNRDNDCPPNSQDVRSTNCQCRNEYRKSDDSRSCVPKSRLFDWNEAIVNQGNDFGEYECRLLYPKSGRLVVFNSTIAEKGCQCERNTFRILNGTQCWPLLYTNLTEDLPDCFIPNSEPGEPNSKRCICVAGFRPTTLLKRDCERIRASLGTYINMAAGDVDPVNSADCRELFGYLSLANGTRCLCPENIAFQAGQESRCYAFLNVGINNLPNASCPKDASVIMTSPPQCQCNPGFISSNGNRTCTTADIPLSGTKTPAAQSNCANSTYNNNTCFAKYGDGAFCEDNQCWCNSRISFKTTDNLCDRFSNYIFPGAHERNNFSCDTVNDCIAGGININTVECRRIIPYDEYKVCICKSGWYLNPKSQICETRCPLNCNGLPNSECIGYECQCKYGFIKVNNSCIQNRNVLQLYTRCNDSFAANNNNNLLHCSSCRRGECALGYKDTGFQCVKYNFDNDRCISKSINFCSDLINHSECHPNDNKCVCSTGYYRDGNRCVRPFNYQCVENEDCDTDARCVGKRCQCNDRQRVVNVQDAFSRTLKRCSNGVDQIRFSSVLLLLIGLVRVFFA